jgi:thymidylate synthase (FAD)
MKLIEPSFQIEQAPPYHDMLAVIEKAARTCYQSWDKIKDGSSKKLIKHCINRGHHSILEHCSITVRIICDRGVSHELVRHRLCAFSQESQRYCAYKDDVEYISPHWCDHKDDTKSTQWAILMYSLKDSELRYHKLLKAGIAPQDARAVLPNATKTEICMTCNIREARHIFSLRCSKGAHPEMRRIMLPMRKEFANRWPVFFEDLMF